jgi:dolichol-phosphate mannosyltransferase
VSDLSGRTVSVVTPVYNEAECLNAFYQRARTALAACAPDGFELIFVDDGSTDRTSAILAELAAKDPAVKLLTLSRNFGHHPAVFAGLEFASGNDIVLIDADLQDPPELIPELLAKRRDGYELVFGRRIGTRESVVLKTLKRAFRALMRRISNIEFPSNVGVFSAMDRRLKDLLLTMPERERYLVAMQMYLGFRVGYVDYQRDARHAGRPKQDLPRLFRLGMNSLFAYSSLPLQLAMAAGLLCLSAVLIGSGVVLYHKFVLHVAIPGWASIMLAILGMGTVQLLSLWIICEYIERIFENTKGRPYFVVWKQTGQPGILATHSPVATASPQQAGVAQ